MLLYLCILKGGYGTIKTKEDNEIVFLNWSVFFDGFEVSKIEKEKKNLIQLFDFDVCSESNHDKYNSI
jgi:hypothetical protein